MWQLILLPWLLVRCSNLNMTINRAKEGADQIVDAQILTYGIALYKHGYEEIAMKNSFSLCLF